MTYEEKSAIVIEQLRADRDRLLGVLEKIRAEIEELKNAPPCFDDMFEYKYAVDEVLAIIDKYRVESEDKE